LKPSLCFARQNQVLNKLSNYKYDIKIILLFLLSTIKMLALRTYNRLLNEKPIITKCVTSFFTFGTGDLMCQYLERLNDKGKKLDLKRFFRQASFGFLASPYLHFHFCWLIPKLFKGSTIKSLLYDQTVGVVVFTSAFFMYLDITSGKSFETAKEELKAKLWPTCVANWKIWPALMFINFQFVPVQYRVLFSNIAGMFWVAYLSYIQNVKSKRLVQEHEQHKMEKI
jgi:hypothetical protein